MASHRSALGRTIDMAQIAAKNEHVRAVGNMNVNARGDTIDSHGKVVVPVTKKVGDAYQRTVSNRAANLIRQKNGTGPIEPKGTSQEVEVSQPITSAPIVEEPITAEELLPEELEFEDEDEAAEIEALRAQEAESGFVIKPASEAPDYVMPDVTKTTKKK